MSDAIIEYCCNRASEDEIAAHLRVCDESFIPPLSSRVEIGGYAHKIAKKAQRFEAWANGELVGLLATYCNAPDRSLAFITSVSILPHWRGRGLASQLLADCIAHVCGLGFARLELEVGQDNGGAIELYKKYGFVVQERSSTLLKMIRDLGKGSADESAT